MNPLTAVIPKGLVITAAVAVLVAAFGGYSIWLRGTGYAAGSDAIQKLRDADTIKATREHDELQAKYRTAEGQANTAAAENKRIKDEQDALVDARVNDIVSELRKRPNRPSPAAAATGVPAVSCPAAAGTGASLYAEDGEFLIREAARADKIRTALQQCYADVDAFNAASHAVNTPR